MEFLNYINQIATDLGLEIKIHVARAELPTLTAANKNFYDDWQGDKFPKNGELDALKHSDKNSAVPLYICDELSIIDAVLKDIQNALQTGATLSHLARRRLTDILSRLITTGSRAGVWTASKFTAATFTLPDFGLTAKETMIDERVWEIYKHELISGREVWGMLELGYRPPDNEARPKISGKIRLLKFQNFCPYSVNTDFYKDARKNFSFDEWLDILLSAVDYNAAGFSTAENKLTMLPRLLPFVEKRLNLIKLAPKGTGKSYLFGQVSRFGWLSSVGVMSRAKMFYDMQKRQ